MRLPKNVTIADLKFEVVRDPKRIGAYFDYKKRKIIIGSKHPREVFDSFLHEITEIACVERGMRFKNHKSVCGRDFCNGELLFCGDHEQFEYMVTDVARILEPMLSRKK